mgnify:CR=1 FL=1
MCMANGNGQRICRGIAMGAASHATGTASLIAAGEQDTAAIASVSIVVCGVLQTCAVSIPPLRRALECEGLKATTRIMHVLAWLLNHRAFLAGQLSEVQWERHTNLPPDRAPATDLMDMLDMPTTMSKFLVMGMSLFDVIRLSTCDAAEVINRPQHGHLTVGASADVTVLKLSEGEYGYCDAFGGYLQGDRRLTCDLTILDGEIVFDWNGRSGIPYREMGDMTGVRDTEVLLRPPG